MIGCLSSIRINPARTRYDKNISQHVNIGSKKSTSLRLYTFYPSGWEWNTSEVISTAHQYPAFVIFPKQWRIAGFLASEMERTELYSSALDTCKLQLTFCPLHLSPWQRYRKSSWITALRCPWSVCLPFPHHWHSLYHHHTYRFRIMGTRRSPETSRCERMDWNRPSGVFFPHSPGSVPPELNRRWTWIIGWIQTYWYCTWLWYWESGGRSD